MELARALAGGPKLILMDECFAGLSKADVEAMSAQIRRLAAEGMTIAIIEHTMGAMVRLVDRFVVLDRGRDPGLPARPRKWCATPTWSPPISASAGSSMLALDGIEVRYGGLVALHDVTLHVDEGEFVAVIGPNGAGKTTLFKAISGVVPLASGSIRFDGAAIDALPAAARPHRGIAHVPEGRQVFGDLTVRREPAARHRCVARPARGAAAARARVRAVPDPGRTPRRSRPGRCPAASSRCWRSGAGSRPARAC